MYCMLYKPDFPYFIFAKSLEFSKSLQDKGGQGFLKILNQDFPSVIFAKSFEFSKSLQDRGIRVS